ncbi:MAG: hypothetical protein KDK70_34740, partial [Myxococcales bacterium]|nr:hypothetical protein [Myxococcales bacterium]
PPPMRAIEPAPEPEPESEDEAPAAPEPAATVAVPTPVPLLPTPVDEPPSQALEDLRRAKGLINGGAVMLSFGLASLAFVAIPAWLLRRVALDRAASDPLLVDESRLYERAERRLAIGAVSTVLGVGLVAGGIPMLAIGIRRREAAEAWLRLGVEPQANGLRVRLRF